MPPCLLACLHVYVRVLSCVDGSACGALSKRGFAPMARCLYPFLYIFTLLYKNTRLCIKHNAMPTTLLSGGKGQGAEIGRAHV